MNLNILILAVSCLGFGISGFLLGKRSGIASYESKASYLLRKTDPMLANRPGAAGTTTPQKPTKTGIRPIQTTANPSTKSIQTRLLEMENILRNGNTLQRSRAMLSWINTLELNEFKQAVEHFRTLGLSNETLTEYNMLLSAWAEMDPVAALEHMNESNAEQDATDTVLAAWASRDPDAAIRWATANHNGQDANPYIAGIIRGLAATDPERATAILQEMPFSKERGEALTAIMPHVLQLGPEKAREWIANLTDEKLRDGATARFAKEMAKQNPAETASWLLANLGENSTRSVDEVYQEWAKTDPAAALSSFESLPPGEAQRRALGGLVQTQSREDPAAAANLMNQYPEIRDERMIRRFIWNTFRENPALAINQIASLEDERRRNQSYSRLFEMWQGRDPQAANQWLETANLPEQVRSNLTK